MAVVSKQLAPAGTTGNNTHNGVCVGAADAVAVSFIVEVAGGTPTVTWKVQGSLDNLNWFDVQYVTDASDTGAKTALTATAVGAQVIWLDTVSGSRFYDNFRLVTSSNTNVTYRCEMSYLERRG